MQIGSLRIINTKTTRVVDEPGTVTEKIAKQKQQVAFTAAFVIIIVFLVSEPLRIYSIWLFPNMTILVDQNWLATLQNAFMAAIGVLIGREQNEQAPVIVQAPAIVDPQQTQGK